MNQQFAYKIALEFFFKLMMAIVTRNNSMQDRWIDIEYYFECFTKALANLKDEEMK